MLLVLSLSSFAWQLAFGIYRSIWSNFLVEEHGIRADQFGRIESLREVPGFFPVLLVALVASLSPSLLSGLCCLLIAVGLVLYPAAHGLAQLTLVTILFSVGFHMLFPAQNTLVLHHAGQGEKGRWLGLMEGVGSAAALLATGVVAASVSHMGFRGLFYMAAAAAAAGAAVYFVTPGPRCLLVGARTLNIRREYVTYYVMTLLQGARRHVFLVFALYNLVEVNQVSAATIAALLGIAGAASIVTRPLLGRLADRLGETKVLAWCYALTGLVFVGYAFVHNVAVLCILYVLDSVLNFELVIVLYAYTVAKGSEVASALAGGSFVGHITGVLVPFSGGLLWAKAGPAATFLSGTAVCLVGFVYSVALRRRIARRTARAAPTPGSFAPGA